MLRAVDLRKCLVSAASRQPKDLESIAEWAHTVSKFAFPQKAITRLLARWPIPPKLAGVERSRPGRTRRRFRYGQSAPGAATSRSRLLGLTSPSRGRLRALLRYGAEHDCRPGIEVLGRTLPHSGGTGLAARMEFWYRKASMARPSEHEGRLSVGVALSRAPDPARQLRAIWVWALTR